MINLNEKMIKASFPVRYMSVKKFQIILSKLQKEDVLYPNQVGNLAIVRKNNYIGYIDFSDEDIKMQGT